MTNHSGNGARTSSSRSRRAPATVALALVATAALSACGSSSDASASGDQTVTVGVPGNVFDLPLQLAQSKGYFSDAGLTVKFVTITASTGTSALKSGSIDFLHSSPTSFLAALSQKIPVTAVGADAVGNPLGIVVSTSFAEAHGLTADSSEADVAKALDGSTAGVSSTNTQAEAGILLKNEGLDPDTAVKWVTLPSPAADQAALKNGEIDWFITSNPLPLQVEADGDGVVVAGPDKVAQWAASGYTEFIVASDSYLEGNSATTKTFLAAVQKATSYVHDHEDDADVQQIAAAAYPNFTSSVLQASIDQIQWPESLAMDADGWTETLGFQEELGTPADKRQVASDDWTNSYLS